MIVLWSQNRGIFFQSILKSPAGRWVTRAELCYTQLSARVEERQQSWHSSSAPQASKPSMHRAHLHAGGSARARAVPALVSCSAQFMSMPRLISIKRDLGDVHPASPGDGHWCDLVVCFEQMGERTGHGCPQVCS